MRPRELWRALEAGEHREEMAPALAELAEAPLVERGPWLARVQPLLEHESVSLRAAAIALFAGVDGVPGLRRIVAALDDDAEPVRLAAVRALAVTAAAAPARWAHALFHARVDVRLAAVAHTPESARWLLAWSRADPELAGRELDAPWPADALPLVIELWMRALVSAESAAAALCAATVEQLRGFLALAECRASTELRDGLAAASEPDGRFVLGGVDVLDAVLEILVRAGAAGEPGWGPLTDALLDPSAPELRTRACLSACVVGTRVGWSDALARVALVGEIRWLGFASVPADVRRAAIPTIAARRDAIVAPPPELVEQWLRGDLVRHADGGLDLTAAAGLAVLLPGRRLRALLDVFGWDELLASIRDEPRGWDAMCRLPCELVHLWWIDRVAPVDADLHARLAAIAITRWAGDAQLAHRIARVLRVHPDAIACALLSWLPRDDVALPGEVLDRLADLVVTASGGDQLAVVLAAASQRGHDHGLARAWFGALLRRHDIASVVALLSAARTDVQRAALAWLQDGLTPDATLLDALARAWQDHGDPVLREFGSRELRRESPPPAPRDHVVTIHRIGDAERERIATCADDELDAALAAVLASPSFGLTTALARRRTPSTTRLDVCAALLACVDGLEPVARELDRFGRDVPGFDDALLHAALTLWRDADAVPPLVDAVLVCFPRNAEGFATWLESEEGGHWGALRWTLGLPSSWVRRTLWHAAALVIGGWAWRNAHRRVASGRDDAVLDMLVAVLDTEVGTSAARLLAALYRGKLSTAGLARVRPRALALAPACTRETLVALSGWLPVAGMVGRDAPTRRARPALPADERGETRRTTDIGALAQLCRVAGEGTVHEAALRLVELGEPGCAALLELLAGAELPFLDAVLESITLWPSGAALARLPTLLGDTTLALARRYRIAVALAERGDAVAALRAVELAGPRDARIVRDGDFERLRRSGVAQDRLVEAALAAGDALLVDRAAQWVFTLARDDPRHHALLHRMLDDGAAASPAMRSGVAMRLLECGDSSGLPWVLPWTLDPAVAIDTARGVLRKSLSEPASTLPDLLVDIALQGGAAVVAELRVIELLEVCPVAVQDSVLARLLLDGNDPAARKRLVAARQFSRGRGHKLRELADVFAWGVMRGRELTGRQFSIHITPQREQWGYTHIGSAAIHVTPLPILTGERHGRDIVEGLVLHELGHHVWHSGTAAKRVWKRAQKAGLFQLLNLVADEHLERNLRSLDADFGDRIKRLDAHAFQHAARELELRKLLDMLGADAPVVLAEIAPHVAYDAGSVRIDSGRLLAELARRGNAFARFVRALRMGLGNRAGDPVVDAALAHFGGGFRNLDMAGLYRVTRSLAALFGGAARLARCFGGHESIEWNERDADVMGDGIADADVQREVQRILEPPRARSSSAAGRLGSLMINVGADASYKKITKVQPLVPDVAKHRAQADPVRRHAMRLRETLQRLGLAHRPVQARLRGHALDRSRIMPLVTRGDPRILRAREVKVASDLFLGVVVDCSGSMSGANLDRARRFAVLVAEAARGLPGVDARFFGFTDSVIYEAGDAQRCAASSLEASGGNNDAAALDHVARVAAGSLRRAKLLVMVSDGMPTECSVAALRGVVTELGRRHHMLCAQVAVRPLDEVCFPNYVLLDEANLDLAVRRFAELIGRLVGRALTT